MTFRRWGRAPLKRQRPQAAAEEGGVTRDRIYTMGEKMNSKERIENFRLFWRARKIDSCLTLIEDIIQDCDCESVRDLIEVLNVELDTAIQYIENNGGRYERLS